MATDNLDYGEKSLNEYRGAIGNGLSGKSLRDLAAAASKYSAAHLRNGNSPLFTNESSLYPPNVFYDPNRSLPFPFSLGGLENWLPLNMGSGASLQYVPDIAKKVSTTYLGTNETVETDDPQWVAKGLHFTGAETDIITFTPGIGTDSTFFICVNGPIRYSETDGTYSTNFFCSSSDSGSPLQGMNLFLQGFDGNDTFQYSLPDAKFSAGEWRTYCYTTTANTISLFANAIPFLYQEPNTAGKKPALAASLGPEPLLSSDFTAAYIFRFTSALNQADVARLHNYIKPQVSYRGINLPTATIL